MQQNLIYHNGISFDDADLKPNASRARACQFKEDENLLEKTHVHRTITDSSKTEAHVAADEIRNTMIRNHCVRVDTNFQCPFVSFASKYNQETQKTNDKQKKTLYTTCSWIYPRVTIYLFDDEASPEVNKNVDEHEHKTKIHDAFNANFTAITKNKVGVDEAKQISDNTTQKSSITWEATGGNTLQNNNVAAWQTTVSNSQYWRVIEYGEFIPTYKLLNEKLQKQIERILYIYKMKLKRWEQNGKTIAETYPNIHTLYKSILSLYAKPIAILLVANYVNRCKYVYDWAFGNHHSITNMIVDEENNSPIIVDYGKKQVIRLFNGNEEILVENINCYGLAKDKYGFLYVSDIEKHEVRRWKVGEGKGKSGELVAGGNGRGVRLNQLDDPAALIVDDCGSILWQIARMVEWCEGETEGEIVIRGGDRSNQLYYPTSLSFDVRGNFYIMNSLNRKIQRFDLISDDNLYP
ncbi:unnamed protein product [Adineta ricciae]|uniref:Uncharacterized protein n=1 Tax=Adineta ricciae TaxID=249248 RepID=A0A814J6B8_ADIRI|nr:unnamed protein product [Adineta ricciae]CAF1100554.1 unnamed protein product [Adineta ricciae]